jgi:hypothetical protein
MQRLRVLALSTVCLAAALSGCQTTKRAAVALRPDLEHPDKFICEPAGTRPQIPPEYVIDWGKVTTVAQAHAEHDRFVGTLRTREGAVAGYVLDLEAKHFVCFNSMQWQKDYYSKLPSSGGGSAALGRIRTPLRYIGTIRTPDGRMADLTVSV